MLVARRWYQRLFTKYVAIFVVLIGGALITSGAVQTYFSYRENEAALLRLQQEKAAGAAARIEQFLNEVDRQVGSSIPPPWLESGWSLDQRRDEYLKLLRLAPAVAEVRYLDAAGKEQLLVSRFALNSVGSGTDYSTDTRFTEARVGSTSFSPVYFRNQSEPYMSMAVREGPASGVTVAEVNLKLIWDVITRIKIGDTGSAFVVDSAGRLVSHPNISLVLQQTDLSTLPEVSEALSGGQVGGASAGTTRDLQGREVLSAHQAIQPLGWLVFVDLPVAEGFGPLYASLARTGLLLLVGLALAILASLGLARRMVRPIEALQVGATRIGSGDLDQRIEVRTGDELETLADSFNDMAVRLAEYYAWLQRTVAERERATLDAVMESMSDGLVVLDADRRISYSNAQAEDLLGVPPERLQGLDPTAALAAVGPGLTDPEAAADAWVKAFATIDEKPRFDLAFPGPRDVSAQVFPVKGPEATDVGVGILLRDITAERDLQRTKDELVSVVSHELRTPLASLVGFAELLLSREYSGEQQKKYLNVMLEEGRRLTALINDFLDLQRMESGRQQLDLAPMQLSDLLTRAIEAAGEDPQHPFVVDLSADLPSVRADAARIQEVVGNLISNGRKYSPDGGEVHIGARAIDGLIEVSVEDPGLGLPPEAIPRLFQKFYRVDNTDRRRIKGTGLGLAICKEIVEAHGGRIWAESAGLGQGSRFAFTLPAITMAEAGDVLVIEDDVGFAQLLAAEFATRGLSVVHSPSAEMALDHLAAARPSGVVLDLVLPGLSGEGFLEQLAASSPGGKVLPVVVVTVKDLTADEAQALQRLGAVAVYQKGPEAAAQTADTLAPLLAGASRSDARSTKPSGGVLQKIPSPLAPGGSGGSGPPTTIEGEGEGGG